MVFFLRKSWSGWIPESAGQMTFGLVFCGATGGGRSPGLDSTFSITKSTRSRKLCHLNSKNQNFEMSTDSRVTWTLIELRTPCSPRLALQSSEKLPAALIAIDFSVFRDTTRRKSREQVGLSLLTSVLFSVEKGIGRSDCNAKSVGKPSRLSFVVARDIFVITQKAKFSKVKSS
jgi:hypothetical protein